MHFDGGFSLEGSGAGIMLTSPTGDKLYYVVQLCFNKRTKVSNNIPKKVPVRVESMSIFYRRSNIQD